MLLIRSFAGPLAGLLLLLYCTAAPAVTRTDIYTATLPVPDQSAEARAAAVTQAFEQVLVKMTGQRDVAARPEAQALLASSGRYLAAFRYEQETIIDPETNENREQTLLQARFDAQAMARAVREAGLPLWGDERPTTLVWLALEDGGQRVLLSGDAADDPASFGAEALEALQAAAAARGIPLLLPLLDGQDRAQVAYADVAGGFAEQVLAASERYGADAVLVGRVLHTGQVWSGRWQLLEAGQPPSQWENRDPVLEAALQGGINPLADTFAARFALQTVSGAVGSQVDLRIDGVDSLAAYARVLDYLEKLTPVQNAIVREVAAQQLVIRLALRGDVAHLERALKLGRVLAPVDTGIVPWQPPATNLPPLPGAAQTDATGTQVAAIAELNYRYLP